jgi:hypothetical protein
MESKKYIIFIDNTGKCALPLIAQHYDVIVFLLIGHVTGSLYTEKKSSSMFIDGRYMRDKFSILKGEREGDDISYQECHRRFSSPMRRLQRTPFQLREYKWIDRKTYIKMRQVQSVLW